MGERSSSLVWSPVRAFAALFVSAVVLGAVILVGTCALLVATLVFHTGGLVIQALIAGIKILGPVVMALVILAGALLGLGRPARA